MLGTSFSRSGYIQFAGKACVNMFGTSDVACPVINGTYDTGSQRTADATADSVITYIDLAEKG